jgi:hypothetical protein
MEDEPGKRVDEKSADAASIAPTSATRAGELTTEADKLRAGTSEATKYEATKYEVGKYEAKKSEAGKSEVKNSSALTRWVTLSVLLCVVLISSFLYLRYKTELISGLKTGADKARVVLTGKPTLDPYAEAVSKIEGDRGEATGRSAKIDVPEELKQYKEPRRFLAIQGAAADEAGVHSPRDFAELAEMIKEGRELVEVPRLGRGYVLYGVGLTATGELTHYDLEHKTSVPLFAGDAELKAFTDGLASEQTRLEAELKELEVRLKETLKKEKEERARLLADIKARNKELGTVKDGEKRIATYYGKAGARAKLFAEYDVLARLASDFGGRAYDLRDTASAKEFEARMLSFIRPAALSVLEELASGYESKYERPLAVTSLVRTEEYQRLLRESGNPNAADVAPPPHTTGLAFDIYYRYMTAAEQEFVMAEIARLESAGRVEALRELRDHYHVFVFPNGHRPAEKLVEQTLRKREAKH